jgi:sodium/hydrogen antiporter
MTFFRRSLQAAHSIGTNGKHSSAAQSQPHRGRYRYETSKEAFASTVDMALNIAVFTWVGAAAPWVLIFGPEVAPFTHFLLAGLGILLLRRIPVIVLLSGHVRQLNGWREALTAGFFGPMGVSAIYYLFLTLKYLSTAENQRHGSTEFEEALRLVIWFCVITSIIVHGSCIGIYQAGSVIASLCRARLSQGFFRAGHPKMHDDVERQPLLP